MAGLEAALGRGPRRRRAKARTGSREALERLGAQVAEREQAAQEAARGLGDDDLPGSADRLQPGGEVGRLADHRLFLRGALADQVAHDDQPGRDPDPGGQRLAVAVRSAAPPPPTTARPARTARSASSSCARGQPK